MRSVMVGAVYAVVLCSCLAEGSTVGGDAGFVGGVEPPDATRLDARDGGIQLGDAIVAAIDAHDAGAHGDAKIAKESGTVDAGPLEATLPGGDAAAPPSDAAIDAGAPSPDAPAPCGGLAASTTLQPGQSVVSCDGRFQLVMQSTDGNLVLYFAGAALWNANTAGNPGAYAAMQGDGNFVVYGPSSVALWQAGTAGNPGADLAVQEDGNVVVYSTASAPLWSTGTCCH